MANGSASLPNPCCSGNESRQRLAEPRSEQAMTALPPFWSWGGARLVPKLGANWLWCVLAGCLGMLFLAASVFFIIVSIAFGAMKSSDAYKTALSKAKADPRVVNALGSPITDGFFVWGKTNVSGSSGYADLTIPI